MNVPHRSNRIGPSNHPVRPPLHSLYRSEKSVAMEIKPARPACEAALLPIVAIVFIAFLMIGLAMPVLPLHVHDGLGFGTFMVGLVAGSQFAASVVSRVWAGRHSDLRGAKHSVVVGLIVSSAAGLLYL